MMEQESPKIEAVASPDTDIISIKGESLVSIKPVPSKVESMYIGVNQMAIEDMLSDVRREAVEHTNEIVKEGIKGDYATQKAISESERATSNQIDAFEDVTNNSFMTVGRDTADLRAQVISLGFQTRDGFAAAAKDSEINALKTQIEIAKQTTYLSDKIDAGNEKTRDLIVALNNSDKDRLLVERNTELVASLADGRHWRHWGEWRDGQGQWAALNSQLQAFQSQLQETRQGMVNFGTMAGVGQTSTSNNVR